MQHRCALLLLVDVLVRCCNRVWYVCLLIYFVVVWLPLLLRGGTYEVRVKSSQIKPVQVKSSQIKSSQVESNQAKSSRVKSNRVKSSQVKSNQVKSCQAKRRGGCLVESWSFWGLVLFRVARVTESCTYLSVVLRALWRRVRVALLRCSFAVSLWAFHWLNRTASTLRQQITARPLFPLPPTLQPVDYAPNIHARSDCFRPKHNSTATGLSTGLSMALRLQRQQQHQTITTCPPSVVWHLRVCDDTGGSVHAGALGGRVGRRALERHQDAPADRGRQTVLQAPPRDAGV